MRAHKWMLLLSATGMLSAAAFAGQAGSANSSMQASIIGSMPNLTIGGVPSAGAAWTVSQSNVSIQPNGQTLWDVQVQVQNLLLASGAGIGTTGGVRAVAASVVCGGSGGAVAATTPAATLDRSGAAQIQATVSLGRTCLAPVVLVRIATAGSGAGSFIAATGLTINSANAAMVNDPPDSEQ